MKREARLAKSALALILMVGGCDRPGAEAAPWRPSAGHREVPIWPGTPPDAQPVAAPENASSKLDTANSARPAMMIGAGCIRSVSRPPTAIATASATPGGASR